VWPFGKKHPYLTKETIDGVLDVEKWEETRAKSIPSLARVLNNPKDANRFFGIAHETSVKAMRTRKESLYVETDLAAVRYDGLSYFDHHGVDLVMAVVEAVNTRITQQNAIVYSLLEAIATRNDQKVAQVATELREKVIPKLPSGTQKEILDALEHVFGDEWKRLVGDK
jgi:hypothetical protein